MKMKNLSILIDLVRLLAVTGCGKLGKSGKGLPDDGQLHGAAPASKYNLSKASRNGIYPTWNLSHGSQ